MKVPEGITVPNLAKHNMYYVKLQQSLYGLKQSGRMWYNRLSDFLMMIVFVCSYENLRKVFV
jgi:hypothetical protein